MRVRVTTLVASLRRSTPSKSCMRRLSMGTTAHRRSTFAIRILAHESKDERSWSPAPTRNVTTGWIGEMKIHGMSGIRIAATLIGVICGGAAGAQQASDGGDNLPRPRTQAATCDEVNWEKDLLERYPRIGDGCQEVVISEGRKWARFEAEFIGAHDDGRVTLDFKDRNGRSIEAITLLPASAQRARLDGRSYELGQLTRGQELNLYLPEGIFAVATEPGASPEQLAQIVVTPVQLRAQVAQEPTGPLLAQANPPQGRTPQALPNTAGPLPLFALAGLISLLGGLGLTIRRRFFPRK
jgi:hypothetical protein